MIGVGTKLIVFLTCYEFAVCFGLGGGFAFLLAASVAYSLSFTVQLLGHAMHLVGADVVRLLLQAVIWLALFWWNVPAWATGLGLVSQAGLFLLLAAIGGAAHRWKENQKNRPARKDRSLLIVLAVIGAVAGGGLALHSWGSLWPLIGYGLVLILPMGIGWQLVPLAARRNADAQFGDADSFADAGFSRDR